VIEEEVGVVALAMTVASVALVISQVLVPRGVVEPFSEIGVLGPNMMVGDYPRTVSANGTLNLFVYLGNHEGRILYYVVHVKLGDEATLVDDATPADVPVVATYEAILANGQSCTIPVSITPGGPNGHARLIFELWVMGEDGMELEYHGRWLQVWIDIT